MYIYMESNIYMSTAKNHTYILEKNQQIGHF